MEPLRNITWGLQFAAQRSPLWLLLVIPLVAALAWYLYRRQSRDVAPVHAIGLALLRCLLVVVLAFLAFRPSVIRQEVLRFPGRLLVLFDDSGSMSVPDPHMPPHDALRIARMDDSDKEGSVKPPHRLAESLANVRAETNLFRRYSKDADRSLDSFWERAETFESSVRQSYQSLGKAIPEIARKNPAVSEAAAKAEELIDSVDDDLSSLTTGNRHPGKDAFNDYAQRVQEIQQRLLDIQKALDEEALSTDTQTADQLRTSIEDIHSTTRTKLVDQTLETLAKAGETELGDQYLQYQSLTTGGRSLQKPEVNTESDGPSPILREVLEIIEEEEEFPLSAVLLLSDGRDTEGGAIEAISKLASRNKTPVHSVFYGTEEEPPDLAVLDVRTPPVAVRGRQVDVRVLLKTATPSNSPESVAVKLLDSDGTVVEEQDVSLGEQENSRVVFRLTPEEVGVKRYRVEMESIEGEVVAERNNRAQFAIRVRDEPVNVLFLDTKPRWESRFALNVLRRLDYVQLNSIVVLTSKNKELVRGAERGQWPIDLSGLQMYDLIVLGNVDEETLSEEEWEALRSFTHEEGGTLCFLNGAGGSATRRMARSVELYPLTESSSEEVSSESRLSARFRLTESGQFHAVTRGLSVALPLTDEVAPDQLAPRTVALITDEAENRAVAACRFTGAGITLALDTSLLWKRLNTSHLDVHENLFLNLVSWAADVGPHHRPEADAESGDGAEDNAAKVWPGERLIEQETVKQIFADEELLGTSASMTSLEGGEAHEAEYVPLAGANGVCAARFEQLPPARYQLQLSAEEIHPSYQLVVSERAKELRSLSRNTELLDRVSESTGGSVVPLVDADSVLPLIEPKVRIEEHRSVYRLWDAVPILFILIGALSIEWIWRKLAGLI